MFKKNSRSIWFEELNALIVKKAVAQTCSVKKVFLEISQNSQENTCARASFLIKLQAPFFTEHLWWLLLLLLWYHKKRTRFKAS